MKKIKGEMKDWQIAQMMFGRNTKKECKLIKELRKHGNIHPLCEDWSVITDNRIEDDCGWLIPNECLN